MKSAGMAMFEFLAFANGRISLRWLPVSVVPDGKVCEF